MERPNTGRFAQAPKGGLSGYVERTLKQALIEGKLLPGERLVAKDLAAQLDVSPTPVREALLKLVAYGALEISPAQSFQVPVITRAQYAEIALIREAIESLATSHAARAIDTQRIDQLASLDERYKAARRRGRSAEALKLNREFRFCLYEAAQMPILMAQIEQLWLRVGPCLHHIFPIDEDNPFEAHNYDKLVSALRAHDSKAAATLIGKAVREGTEIILERLGQ
ncbi:FCD domain-containing protein [Halotalea alkalilenta]|uniref:FCD domain-containing protein n=1 Tax=Halotalea alkalilenta TaxID=376489 RepID=UPI0004872BD7|nr:FCD domain-containing protein [Halotalea alkalilenta]